MLSSLLSSHAWGTAEWGPLLQAFIAFAWLVYFAETWLDWRQHRLFFVEHKPKEISYATGEEFRKAQLYGQDKSRLNFVSSLWGVVKLTIQFLVGYYPALWILSGSVMKAAGLDGEITQSLVLFCLDALVESVVGLPLSLYKTFVIEERHGFNKQTLSLFLADQLKGFALSCVVGAPLIGLFLRVITWGGPRFYLYVAALFFVVQILAVPFYSNFIQPCFNKLSPLPEGALRTAIESLASRIHFPLRDLYVIDGSKRSSHSNAYFTGLPCGHKRIVLFDTLIEQSSQGEVVSVLGHELGHWKLNHVIKGLIVNQLQMMMLFFLFGQMIHSSALYDDFGFGARLGGARPVYIGLLFFQCVYSPIQHVLQWGMNVLSRKHEFEADRFAVDLGYGADLKGGLITLQKENRGTMIPDPLYSSYHHSHPPMLERINAIDKAMQQGGKKTE